VYVDRSANDAAATVINNNNFTGSGRYGIRNQDPVFIDGSNNWWSDAPGPSGAYGEPASLGDSVSNYVTWSPPLASPEGTAPTPAPPAALVALLAGSAAVAMPADATAAPISVDEAAVDPEQETLRRANEARRAEHAVKRTDRETQRAVRRAEADAEREALRQAAVRRRANVLAEGGRP
jgi:hypothetical protein